MAGRTDQFGSALAQSYHGDITPRRKIYFIIASVENQYQKSLFTPFAENFIEWFCQK